MCIWYGCFEAKRCVFRWWRRCSRVARTSRTLSSKRAFR